MKLRAKAKTITINYSYGRRAKDRRPKAFEATWPEFVAHLLESTDADLYPAFQGDETKAQYTDKKNSLPYVSAIYTDRQRNNDHVESRSLIYIDLDGTTSRVFRNLLSELDDLGYTYVAHTTTGDRHDVKDGKRCYRVILPTDRPMSADEIHDVQCKFTHSLGLWDTADRTAHERARLMYCPAPGAQVWENTGKPVSVRRVLRDTWEPPCESGDTNWTEEALANADENSRAIADWCHEEGLDALPSGRGWAITCPNCFSHTDNDGSDGSTAIMLPDSIHPEVRFVCKHEHCQDLNKHQHLALGLAGVPSPYLPEAHNISRKQIELLMPHLDPDDVEQIYATETEAAAEGADHGTCTDEDLADPVILTRRDPLIEGMLNCNTIWHTIGESNIGKSFYILGQMAAVAAGIPFAGAGTRKSHCFYFDAEGGETTQLRKEALAAQYGDPLEWLHIVDLQQYTWDITSKAGINSAVNHIRKIAGEDPVGMVAFDSLNQTVSVRKFDENSSGDMGELVAGLKAIATRTGGAVGVIHHPAKGTTDSPRGSTALHAAVDAAFCVELPDPEKPLQLNVSHLKARNGVKQRQMGFLLAKYEAPRDDTSECAELPRTGGPDFSEHTKGFTVQPVFIPKSNETLWLVPVALAPFATPAAEAGRDAVRKSANDDELPDPQGKTQELILATLELMPDRPEGYSLAAIIKFDREYGSQQLSRGGTASDAIKKLLAAKLVVRGRDSEQNIIATNVRLPLGINDLKDVVLVASNEDLN